MATELLYLTDSTNTFEYAEIIDIYTNEQGLEVLVLDKTIFYPQGGGQPYDNGYIRNSSSQFKVTEVRFIEGVVHHIGTAENGKLQIGNTVRLEINSNRRKLNSMLHSAGHLIDMALREIGLSELIPIKGYHFPDGPYVEYQGDINVEDVIANLQTKLDIMINQGYEVQSKLSSLEEAKSVCYFMPPYIPEGKPVRIVSVWNHAYIPCGGTHVNNINELVGLRIKEIKSKKGNSRVSYTF